jgi:OmpA-OmpF porin, OOP family
MKNWIMPLAAGLALAACSSTPKYDTLPESTDAREEIGKLQQDLGDAQKGQTDILAPQAWKDADYYFKRAQSDLADNDSNKTVLKDIAKSHAYLKRAQGEADSAQTTIPEILQVRQEALQALAPQFAQKEWVKADEAFRSLTKDREGEKFGVSDDNRGELRDLYINAQVVALQNEKLGSARAQIHDAGNKKADSLTPHVYDQAMMSLKNAEAFIAANRMDMVGIDKQTDKANADSALLTRVIAEAISAKNSTPEQEAMKAEQAAMRMDKAKQRNAALAGALDQDAFEQKYDEARQMFNPQEAEVYKQGDKLLIRLKGIGFATSRASLPSSSFALLTKVGNVTKNFGGPQIRIEGHTDSVGSKAKNLRLSQDRAEAVKSYMVANAGVAAENIEVVGMGDTRPLATNKTAAGRAQNRRVDVILTPSMKDETPQIRQAQ